MNSGRPGSQRYLSALLAMASTLCEEWPVVEQADVAYLCGLSQDEALSVMEAFYECCLLETPQGPEALVPLDLDEETGYLSPSFGQGPWIEAPLRLNGRETRALAEALEAWGVPLSQKTAKSLLEAYGAVLSGPFSSSASRVEEGAQKPLEANLEAQNLVTCSRALLERRCLSFPYQSHDREPRERHVEPLDLYEAEGRWYLFGCDRDATNGGDPFRLFRIDRMTGEAIVGDEPCTLPPQAAPKAQGTPVKVSLASPDSYDQGLWGTAPKRKRGEGLVVTPRLQSPSWLWARIAACGGEAVPRGNGAAADKDYRRQVVDHIDQVLAEAGVAVGDIPTPGGSCARG